MKNEEEIGPAPQGSKLNARAVLEIRARRESVRRLAERFGVSRVTIRDVLRRDSWKTVPPGVDDANFRNRADVDH